MQGVADRADRADRADMRLDRLNFSLFSFLLPKIHSWIIYNRSLPVFSIILTSWKGRPRYCHINANLHSISFTPTYQIERIHELTGHFQRKVPPSHPYSAPRTTVPHMLPDPMLFECWPSEPLYTQGSVQRPESP